LLRSDVCQQVKATFMPSCANRPVFRAFYREMFCSGFEFFRLRNDVHRRAIERLD